MHVHGTIRTAVEPGEWKGGTSTPHFHLEETGVEASVQGHDSRVSKFHFHAAECEERGDVTADEALRR